jgi:hypothetical protein
MAQQLSLAEGFAHPQLGSNAKLRQIDEVIRRFCGFALDEKMPEETTIWRFRAAVAVGGVLEGCLEAINRQFAAKGLVAAKVR